MKQQERLIKVDFTENEDVEQILPDVLILSSDRFQWDNLHLRYFRYDPHETPEISYDQHMVIIHTDITSPAEHELSLDGIDQHEELQNGQVVIIPAHTRNSSQWEDRHMLRHYSEVSTTPPEISEGLPPYQLKYVTEYIDAHLAEDISLSQLANQVKLSQSHFSSLFRKSTGLSPYQFLIKQRVNSAKELLLMGDLPIIDVAIAVGFYDQSHLTRHMRRLLGVSPRQIRQQR
jgi:AraC-like DNA-binding protein